MKVSVLTEVNIRRIIMIMGGCRIAQSSRVLLDCLIHRVILRAKFFDLQWMKKPIYSYINNNYLTVFIFLFDLKSVVGTKSQCCLFAIGCNYFWYMWEMGGGQILPKSIFGLAQNSTRFVLEESRIQWYVQFPSCM